MQLTYLYSSDEFKLDSHILILLLQLIYLTSTNVLPIAFCLCLLPHFCLHCYLNICRNLPSWSEVSPGKIRAIICFNYASFQYVFFRPHSFDFESSVVNFIVYLILSKEHEGNVSAKSRSLSCFVSVYWIPFLVEFNCCLWPRGIVKLRIYNQTRLLVTVCYKSVTFSITGI